MKEIASEGRNNHLIRQDDKNFSILDQNVGLGTGWKDCKNGPNLTDY